MGEAAVVPEGPRDSGGRRVNLFRLLGQAVLETKSSLPSFPNKLGKLRDEKAGDVTTDRLNPS